MLTADAEFRAAANAAYTAWLRTPPYIVYRADVAVSVPAVKRFTTVSRSVEVRTKDDAAIIQDLPQGQNQVGHAFPIPPWFDALSYFRLEFHLGDPLRQHNPLTQLTMLAPLTYTDPVAARPEVSVVTTTLRNYYAEYAPDTTERVAHITMQPLVALTRHNDSDFYLHDVYVDTVTNLPTRVVYDGPTTEFAVDYTTAHEPYWLIDHAFYRHTVATPLHLIRTTFTTDAQYTAFAFPPVPADSRLR